MYNTSENLQHYLMLRESNLTPGCRHATPLWHLFHERNFYKSITPRLTVKNVKKPLGFLCKFSPNGKILLAFAADLKSLDVYQYLGVERATHLLYGQQNECISAKDLSSESFQIRQELFDNLFTKKFNIPIVTTQPEAQHYLDTEISLFVANGDFVLLVSITSGSMHMGGYLNCNQHDELFGMMNVCEITLYLVDLRNGRVTDTLEIVDDFVQYSYSLNISLYDHILAVLCSYSQHIELIEVDIELEKFKRLLTFGSLKDRKKILQHLSPEFFQLHPHHRISFPDMETQILEFKYRQIMQINSPNKRREQFAQFARDFGKFQELFMMEIQLVDYDLLLLQYAENSVETLENEPEIYVFYNIYEQKVVHVFTSISLDIWYLVRSYCDELWNVRSLQVPWSVTSPSNNDFFRRAFDYAVTENPGNITEANMIFHTELPIECQSFSASPYLNYSLFTYDHTLISNCIHPKSRSTQTIEFCDPHTRTLKFRIFLEQPHRHEDHKLVSFIFHPYEPFCISIQRFTSRYVMNFHLYNSSTKIKN